MLTLEGIEKVYRTDRIETQALEGIDLEVRAGEFLSIMGPSGSGKSTLLNIIGLLDAPSAGRITFDGVDLQDIRDRERARLRNRRIGFIFQSFHLVPDLSVLDNVEIPLLYRKMGGRARREAAAAALESVGLGGRMRHFPGQLSGGQQQRVAIARAIVGEPALLLADEPTGNLDSVMGAEIMEILLGLNRAGTTVIMVTHDQKMTDRAQRCLRLHDGRPVHQEVMA